MSLIYSALLNLVSQKEQFYPSGDSLSEQF
jgi:hypothetical protein